MGSAAWWPGTPPVGAVYDGTHGRYVSLVAVVDGTVSEGSWQGSIPCAWIAEAMVAPVAGS